MRALVLLVLVIGCTEPDFHFRLKVGWGGGAPATVTSMTVDGVSVTMQQGFDQVFGFATFDDARRAPPLPVVVTSATERS